MAFEELHRPLFREHGSIYFANGNRLTKELNYAFCEVRLPPLHRFISSPIRSFPHSHPLFVTRSLTCLLSSYNQPPLIYTLAQIRLLVTPVPNYETFNILAVVIYSVHTPALTHHGFIVFYD